MKSPLYVSLKPFLDPCALPRPVVWSDIFTNERPVEVEIGSGNGEYLARLAVDNPDVNYIGFEEYCERISRTLRKLSRVTTRNARIIRFDVRPALTYLFAPRTIDFIHCLYPPPWPRKSDIKHRLFTNNFLKLANSRLKDNGAMKIVTDFKPYMEWIEEQIQGSGFSVQRKSIQAKYGTKFERKWVDGGQNEFYEILLTKEQHIDIPHKEDSPLNQYTVPSFNPDRFAMSEYSKDGIAVVFKDILYDPKRLIALVHVMVNDEDLLQNVRIVIVKMEGGWRINLAQGSLLMPTAGIAKSLECVRDAVEQTA